MVGVGFRRCNPRLRGRIPRAPPEPGVAGCPGRGDGCDGSGTGGSAAPDSERGLRATRPPDGDPGSPVRRSHRSAVGQDSCLRPTRHPRWSGRGCRDWHQAALCPVAGSAARAIGPPDRHSRSARPGTSRDRHRWYRIHCRGGGLLPGVSQVRCGLRSPLPALPNGFLCPWRMGPVPSVVGECGGGDGGSTCPMSVSAYSPRCPRADT